MRELVYSTELEESIKWGLPAYTINGKNVLEIAAFKAFVGIWIHQGVFLKDSENMLVSPTHGKSKAMRQWRFHSANEIDPKLVLSYVEEAIQNQDEAKDLNLKTTVPLKNNEFTTISAFFKPSSQSSISVEGYCTGFNAVDSVYLFSSFKIINHLSVFNTLDTLDFFFLFKT